MNSTFFFYLVINHTEFEPVEPENVNYTDEMQTDINMGDEDNNNDIDGKWFLFVCFSKIVLF